MNKIILIGRLTKNPELKYTSSNLAVTNFSLAVNRDFKNQNGEYDADFINCIAYRKLAETIAEYTKKGDKLAVTGRIQTRNYDNAEGKKVYVTEVVVDGIEFLESKKKPVEEKNNTETYEEYETDPFTETNEDMPW